MSDDINLDELSTFASHLADAAARVTVPLFRNLPQVENKLADGFDPVTEADRGAEAAMRAHLQAALTARLTLLSHTAVAELD